jgi:hypothetical protein
MKIIEELLKMKFPTVDTASLMEIIAATPNPEIATEIMCGIYVEPNVGSHKRVQNTNKLLCVFISYNKWINKIEYTYQEKRTRGGYFAKGTKVEDVTIDTFDSLQVKSSDDATYLYIPTGEFRTVNSTMSFEDWMNLPYVPTEAEEKMLASQNIYDLQQ